MRCARRLLLAFGALCAGASAVPAQEVPAGLAVLKQVHDRYANSRFRTVTFVQKTTFPDGRVEWWYEAESIPGKARVDIAPFESRNTSIFRGDSAYVWRNGEHTRRPGPLSATMWTLMDMYAVPPEETAAALQRRNFDLSKVHERLHEGRPVIVIGALEGDTTAAQFWLDREHLYTVKMIVPTPAGRRVVDVSRHTFQNGGWIEGQIVMYLNGNMTLHEEYHHIRTNVTLPPGFFEPEPYVAPHWQIVHPIGPTPAGSWAAAAPLQFARAAHAVVATADAIHALAGSGAGARPVLEVERFDGTQWTVETKVPEGLNAPAAAVIGARIYLIGGFSGVSNLPTATVRVYDTRTKQWSEAAPLPAPRGGHAAVVHDGRIHVFGGGNDRSTIADHSVYDPATNTWTERAPLPRAEGSPAGVAFDGRIWAIGGRSGPSDFGDVYMYDAAADRWSTGPSIEPRGTAGAVVFDGTIWLVGGESQARAATLNSVLRLDAARRAWTEAPPLPTARNYARAVVFRDAIWVVGGSPAAGASHSSVGSNIVERFTGTAK